MTSTRAKGALHVREAKKLFEDIGFRTWKPGNKMQVYDCPKCKGQGCGGCRGSGKMFTSQSQDLFEAFDLVAIRSDSRTLWIQVTTEGESSSTGNKDGAASERMGKAAALPMNDDHNLRVVMARRPGAAWSLWAFNPAKGWGRWNSEKEGRKHVLDLQGILMQLEAIPSDGRTIRPKHEQRRIF